MTDFRIQMPTGRDLRILQISDVQIVDASQARTPDRLKENEKIIWARENIETLGYAPMRRLVLRETPDLILQAGDNVYGQFDDSGRVLREMLGVLSSFGVPYASVFGNHDNETALSVAETCRLYAEAEHSLFCRGGVTGNGNYTVGIYDGDRLVRVIYCMDSNGCWRCEDPSVKGTIGFAEDQLAWLTQTAEALGVPGILFCHVPSLDYRDALVACGYRTEENLDAGEFFEIGVTMPPHHPKDFGIMAERINLRDTMPIRLHETLRRLLIDCMLVGHFHGVCTSVNYDGVRYTFGVKTGGYDGAARKTGGTRITVAHDGTISLSPVYDLSDG